MKNFNFLPDFDSRKNAEEYLMKKYPFLSKQIVGKSLCDRPIYAYSIGETQNSTLYAGAFHGMEWLTSLVLIKFLDDCCNSYLNKQELMFFRIYDFLQISGLTVIPCVNPDGVEIQLKGSKGAGQYKRFVESVTSHTKKWQANAGGVDLNHNFNAGWKELKRLEIKNKITKPGPTRYGGKAPESQPETAGIVSFCKANNFNKAFAFHSQGREIYWDYGKNTPQKSLCMAGILADAAGYTVSKPLGLAVGGGFKDWFISYFKKPAFTVEIGLGENPLPLRDFEEEYKRLLPLLCLGIIL